MAKYEAHITCAREHAAAVATAAEATGWCFSVIDGDPVMGQHAYCYLTDYHADVATLRTAMAATAEALTRTGVPVLRQKIERIVYDTKTGVDELTGRMGPPYDRKTETVRRTHRLRR